MNVGSFRDDYSQVAGPYHRCHRRVGGATARLLEHDPNLDIVAGVRTPEKTNHLGVATVHFDYDRVETLAPALAGVEPGVSNFIRFPVEQQARPTYELMTEVEPDISQVAGSPCLA